MLMMRLQRVGRRNDPSFRIVVTDKRTGPKSNKNVAILGSYNPKLDQVQLDKEEAKRWLSHGVQPSDTVHNILVSEGVINAKKINVLPSKTPIVKEVGEEVDPAKEAGESAEEVPAESTNEETAAETEEKVEEPAVEETAVEESNTVSADEASSTTNGTSEEDLIEESSEEVEEAEEKKKSE